MEDAACGERRPELSLAQKAAIDGLHREVTRQLAAGESTLPHEGHVVMMRPDEILAMNARRALMEDGRRGVRPSTGM